MSGKRKVLDLSPAHLVVTEELNRLNDHTSYGAGMLLAQARLVRRMKIPPEGLYDLSVAFDGAVKRCNLKLKGKRERGLYTTTQFSEILGARKALDIALEKATAVEAQSSDVRLEGAKDLDTVAPARDLAEVTSDGAQWATNAG